MCAPGAKFMVSQKKCEKCERGKFNGAANQTACTSCTNPHENTPKRGSTTSSNCTECETGYTGNPPSGQCTGKECPGDLQLSPHAKACAVAHYGDGTVCNATCERGYQNQTQPFMVPVDRYPYVCTADQRFIPASNLCMQLRQIDCLGEDIDGQGAPATSASECCDLCRLHGPNCLAWTYDPRNPASKNCWLKTGCARPTIQTTPQLYRVLGHHSSCTAKV